MTPGLRVWDEEKGEAFPVLFKQREWPTESYWRDDNVFLPQVRQGEDDWRYGRAGGVLPLRANPLAGFSNPVFQAAFRSNVDCQCQDIGLVRRRRNFIRASSRWPTNLV